MCGCCVVRKESLNSKIDQNNNKNKKSERNHKKNEETNEIDR